MEWPSMQRPIRAPKQLLVEGRTPEIFFREWVEALGLKGKIEVRDFRSLDQLTSFLKVFAGRPEFKETVESVGIIRDAEDKPAAAAFQSVCASLRLADLPCPATCGVFNDGPKRTGVFVLPDCVQPGMLETLCWTILETDPKFKPEVDCVMAHLQCLGRAKVQTQNPHKAKVWTYLAGRGKFDPQVGRAAQNKLWDWNSPALLNLTGFLRSL
jgi:Protein of unknown function (DUF3226)